MDKQIPLKIISYNIHKGFTPSNSRYVLSDLREYLRSTKAEIVFLQEVQGKHIKQPAKQPESQFEYLADTLWQHFAYGKNAVYEAGHHGNAILSKFPFLQWTNHDLSHSFFESRGVLHGLIQIPETQIKIHLLCTHLGLFHLSRKKQYAFINEYIEKQIPKSDPVILAGDFNDWTERATQSLARSGLQEAFTNLKGGHAKTFPSFMPFLPLDRVYTRGLTATHCEVQNSSKTRPLSDHLPILVELLLENGK